MKLKLILALLVTMTITCSAQQIPNWDKWTWLTGTWVGEGSGQPGQGGGTFSFAFDLDKNILVRKSHSEYTATQNRSATIHDDLMIIYPATNGNASKAIYFDYEGHVINYTVSVSDESVVFQSEKMQDVPVFRLTYSLLENETINTKFEMSQDGQNFMTYIEGKSKRTK
jgi:hypothetical protein